MDSSNQTVLSAINNNIFYCTKQYGPTNWLMSFTLIIQVMIIESIPPNCADTAVPVVHQLPEPDMVVNPRPTNKFKVCIKGTTMTLPRINRKENEGTEYILNKHLKMQQKSLSKMASKQLGK